MLNIHISKSGEHSISHLRIFLHDHLLETSRLVDLLEADILLVILVARVEYFGFSSGRHVRVQIEMAGRGTSAFSSSDSLRKTPSCFISDRVRRGWHDR
jgi:hypothetical protein